MVQNLTSELAALRRMPPSELRDKYLAVFGEPSRSGNREYLYKRIAWRLQSLAEGDVAERARRIRERAAEIARDADIRVTMPRQPKTTPGPGGVVVHTRPLHAHANAERLPTPGAILTREYRGRLIEVTVLPKGFEWDGQVYRSLSAVAKAVTGSHWNGFLFFGLKDENQK